ncbi:MAG: DUF116 domain-containing protein [Deltaproteobacteria bacterium]
MTENKAFIKASSILAAILLLAAGGLFGLYTYSDINFINTLLIIAAAIFILLTLLIVIGMLFLINDKCNVQNIKAFRVFYYFYRNIIIPIMNPLSKVFGINKENLERFFIETNNKLVQSQTSKQENAQIVLLLPHCLQNSSCNMNITHDINNCKRCGKCDINAMIEIAEKYDVKLVVVTGGTAARSQLSKLNPGAVVAVACERDLSSGIKDIESIPVYGVLNSRPNGPCNNTRVDAVKIEEALKLLVSKNNFLAGE